jgi:hypothetical protein
MVAPTHQRPLSLAKSRVAFTTALFKAAVLLLIASVCGGSTQALAGYDRNSITTMVELGLAREEILKVYKATPIESDELAQLSQNSVSGEGALPQLELSTVTKYIDIYNIRWGSRDEAAEISGLRGEQSDYYEMYRPILFELKIKNNLPGANVMLYSLVGVGIVLDSEKLKCGEAALFTRPKNNLWQIGAPGQGAIVIHLHPECKANTISFTNP